MRIHIELPDGSPEEIVDLEVGRSLVIGRSPDPTRAGSGPVDTLRCATPSVSATHAVITATPEGARVRDLASRNGTWLRIPDGPAIAIPEATDVHLRLGFPHSSTEGGASIEPPRYEGTGDFAAGVTNAVQRWLVHQRVQVRCTLASTGDKTLTWPLATGETMGLVVEQTIDDRLHELLPKISRYVATQNALYLAEAETREDGMILASAPIRDTHRRVVGAAMSHVSRLVLLGATGTGKERLARTYHRHLGRSGELVTINCATLSRERIVADLFGAEAGAYTGAQRAVVGAVERADGGTLFLDEIGEMPLDVQSQLLRFLDTGEYQRLGATGLTRTSDVFVVAATNRDLRAMVQDQTFRLDLFFRIALEVVDIAPLRDRPADVVGYLASQRVLDALQENALEVLRTHAWPGNFRELANVAARLPRSAAPGSIDADNVRRLLGTGPVAAVAAASPITAPDADWLEWLLASASAYTASNGGRGPISWGDLTTYVEQFLKPYALAHLGHVAAVTTFEDLVVSRVADTIKADRGTVVKQMRRFFESRG